MQYFGGKARISKRIAEYINTHTHTQYAEPFCGSCNVATKVDIPNKILNDKHPYLIDMWKALQEGWIPPDVITEEQYKHIKDNQDKFKHLAGFVGFGCSFAGKYFGGYARDGKGGNYALRSKNSVLRKIEAIKDAKFINKDYSDLNFDNALVYCDPPYRNTTQYYKKLLGDFDYDKFLEWVRKQSESNIVLVSEYARNVPNDAHIVFEVESKTSIRDKNDQVIKTTEILYTFNDI